ncbi:LCP family protein [Bacillus sp. RG28]|uniref:LCP family protein n=1 Tax=Gottfriedia endophytica TaxID=2820819 RepID=A0A940SLQ0_9BACI|nr:LCP family protein [Gottfriedia endophytica]MBP0726528.1 LCP family protein [Gottfriedia endophytica]
MSETRKSTKRKRKKKHPILRSFLVIFAIAIVFIGYKGVKAYVALQNTTKGQQIHSTIRKQEAQVSQPFSILFLGIENYSTKGVGGRTDSMILATVNPKNKTIEKLSIPRDTKVYIPYRNVDSKINGAYNGGLQSAVDTVENFLHVPIDYYVTVDFNGFKNIVDAVGGIDVNVPFDFWEHTDAKPRGTVYFHKGVQHLNGTEALAYSRMRKRDPRGDFGREDRQQQVMMAIIDKLKSPETLLNIDNYAQVFSQNVKTNMSISQGLSVFNDMKGATSQNIETLKLEGNGSNDGGVYYYIADPTSVSDISNKMRAHLNLDQSQTNSVNAQ